MKPFGQKNNGVQPKALKHGRTGKSEVFIFTDQNGAEQWLAVEPLRSWAEENLPIVGVDVDIAKVEDMLSNDRINIEHLMEFTLKSIPRPILVCEDFAEGCSEIVDGSHTYVAMAIARAKAEEMGYEITARLAAPAYVVERMQWSQFLVTAEQRGAKK